MSKRSAHQIRVSEAMKRHWKQRPEQQLQKAVAEYLALALRPPTLWTAFPAGGGGKARGGQLKAMGLKPGWPDILVLHVEVNETSGITRALPMVVGIELKAAKGKLSEEQARIRDSFEGVGADYAIARSVDTVETILRANGIPLHASVSGAAIVKAA